MITHCIVTLLISVVLVLPVSGRTSPKVFRSETGSPSRIGEFEHRAMPKLEGGARLSGRTVADPRHRSPRRDEPDDLFTFRYMFSADGGQSWSDIMAAGDAGMYQASDTGGVMSTWGSDDYNFGVVATSQNHLHFVSPLTAFSEQNDLNPLNRVNGIYDVMVDLEGNSRYVLIAEQPQNGRFTWADCGVDQDDNLVSIWVNVVDEATSEIWASRSEDEGESWSEPRRLLQGLDAEHQYPHMTPHLGQFFYIIYLVPNGDVFEHHIMRVQSNLAGNVVQQNPRTSSGTFVSYYVSSVNAIDQDIASGAVYFAVRSQDGASTTIGYSGDGGNQWSLQALQGAQRYPSIALDTERETPYVFSNYGPPAGEGVQRSWYAYDDLGYNGGDWIGPVDLDEVNYDGVRDLLYCTQGVFTTEGDIVAGSNVWGQFTPEGFQIKRYNSDQEEWEESQRLWSIFDEEDVLMAGWIPQNTLVAGVDNYVFLAFSGAYGMSDFDPPEINHVTLSSVDLVDQWVVAAEITDAESGVFDHYIEWTMDQNDEWEWAEFDSADVDQNANGTYYFTIPHAMFGHDLRNGEQFWFDLAATDGLGNFNMTRAYQVTVGQGWDGEGDDLFPRRVLFLDFTSTTAPPCGAAAPAIEQGLSDVEDIVSPVAIHVWWPAPGNDPWYAANSADNRYWVELFGVNGVPALYIDNTVYGGQRTRNAIRDAVTNRQAVGSPVEMSLDAMIRQNRLNLTVTLSSLVDIESGHLYIALCEDHVEFNAVNNWNDHYNALVKMIPDERDVRIQLAARQEEEFNYELDLNGLGWHELEPDNLNLIAWVQADNRQVYQSTMVKGIEVEASPELAVTPNNVVFGEVQFGVERTLPLSIRNAGEGDLIVTQIECEGASFGTDFEGEFTLQGGEEEVVLVSFNPDNVDDFAGSLSIHSSWREAQVVRVPLQGTGVALPQHFAEFAITDVSHSVLIEDFETGEIELQTGCEVGVFTPAGLLAGAGVYVEGERLGLAAWGDDPQTRAVEGFHAGERMTFKLWDNATDVEYSCGTEYRQGGGNWAPNGMTIMALGLARSQSVAMEQGWNNISINVTPLPEMFVRQEGADIRRMTDQLRGDQNHHHVMIMKDGFGRFYLPEFDFSNIPFWNLQQGYQVKVDEAVEAVWTGTPISFDHPIQMAAGWNMIPYYPQYELSAASPDFAVLASVIDHVEVAKDYLGRFMLPAFRFSNMSPWRVSQGYQVKVDQAVELSYPAEGDRLATVVIAQTPVETPEVKPTGVSMSVLVLEIDGVEVTEGSEILAMSVDNRIVGNGKVEEGRCGLAVWGDDPTTQVVDGLISGEEFHLVMKTDQTESPLNLKMINLMAGKGLIFQTDEFTVLRMETSARIPESYEISEIFPNPFNETVQILYGLPAEGQVRLAVLDVTGREVDVIVNGRMPAGQHRTSWIGKGAANGVYLLRLEAGNEVRTKTMMLLK